VLAMPGLIVGDDMTSCARQRCLYVADSGRLAVHRVCADSTGAGNMAVWPLSDKPSSVSVTRPSVGDMSTPYTAGQSRTLTSSTQ